MDSTEVAVIGAGPHGLAAAARLRRAGVEHHVLGDPMSFWRTMPKGMLLRSNWTATSIAEYDGPLSLESYRSASGRDLRLPLPLEEFLDYGTWVARQAAPGADDRRVHQVTRGDDGFELRLDDGDVLRSRRVVVAAGIADFVRMPAVARDLADGPERGLVSHASEHRDLSTFRGRRVLVVGLGQSALESAALLHEAGASVEIVGRRPGDHLVARRRLPPTTRPPGASVLRAHRRGSPGPVPRRGRTAPVPAAAAQGPGPVGLPRHPPGRGCLAGPASRGRPPDHRPPGGVPDSPRLGSGGRTGRREPTGGRPRALRHRLPGRREPLSLPRPHPALRPRPTSGLPPSREGHGVERPGPALPGGAGGVELGSDDAVRGRRVVRRRHAAPRDRRWAGWLSATAHVRGREIEPPGPRATRSR